MLLVAPFCEGRHAVNANCFSRCCPFGDVIVVAKRRPAVRTVHLHIMGWFMECQPWRHWSIAGVMRNGANSLAVSCRSPIPCYNVHVVPAPHRIAPKLPGY